MYGRVSVCPGLKQRTVEPVDLADLVDDGAQVEGVVVLFGGDLPQRVAALDLVRATVERAAVAGRVRDPDARPTRRRTPGGGRGRSARGRRGAARDAACARARRPSRVARPARPRAPAGGRPQRRGASASRGATSPSGLPRAPPSDALELAAAVWAAQDDASGPAVGDRGDGLPAAPHAARRPGGRAPSSSVSSTRSARVCGAARTRGAVLIVCAGPPRPGRRRRLRRRRRRSGRAARSRAAA